jgi:predicted enzyme related to lactoylglutathione lyase
MNRVVHFEISTDDPERAAGFYRSVFGWKVEKWEGPIDYWLVTTGEEGVPGINGAIKRRPEPGISTVNTIEVDSIDDSVEKIEANGGEVVMPKTEIPDVGFHAYCRDSEGNIFGLIEGGE